MRKWSKWVITGLSMVTLVSTMAACGNKEEADDGKTTIEFFSQKKEMKGTLEEIIADFEKENPEINVKLTNVPDPGTVLKTRIASKDIPDIVNLYPQNADFQEWAKADIFEDLSDKEYLDNLKEGSPETYAINNKVYSVPLTSNAWGFYYNKDTFKELGLETPKTWADFETLVKEIKKQEETPFAASITTADSWTLNGYHQLAWATVNGGYDGAEDALVRSGKQAIKTSNPDFKAVTNELDLLRGNTQKNANGATYDDAVAAFAKGDALIFPNGTWALPAIQNQDPEFEIGMFAYPGIEENEELTVGAADLAVSINQSSKNKEAANKFVAYLTTKEAMQKYYDVDGSPTSVTAVETEDKFPETEGVSQYVFTDKQIVWLQKEWTSEESFWHATVDYINSEDKNQLADNLNSFFDTMK
ncbi:MAG: extracellular solute-binding protein [Carnobacterium sp.]